MPENIKVCRRNLKKERLFLNKTSCQYLRKKFSLNSLENTVCCSIIGWPAGSSQYRPVHMAILGLVILQADY